MNKFFLKNRKLTFFIYKSNCILFPKQRLGSYEKNEPITIVIPAIDKDSEIVEAVVSESKKNLMMNISEVIVVCPKKSKKIINIFKNNDNVRIFYDEEVSPLPKSALSKYKPKGIDRSGWIVQQLIKLAIHDLVRTKKYLVIDADTILTMPQSYIAKGNDILLFSDEFHLPYREHIKKVLGFYPEQKVSFIAHTMLFDSSIVKSMLKKIEIINNKKWFLALVENLDPKEISSMSEYEMYASYAIKYFSSKIDIGYWINKSVPRKEFIFDKANGFKKYKNCRSISYHSYN
jgi:hypothetical protein